MSYKNEKPQRRTISLLLGGLVINILGAREKRIVAGQHSQKENMHNYI